MNSISDLKNILKTDPSKRIGIVSEIFSGSVLLTDLLGRKFKASVPNELTILVGNTVLVVGDVVVGKTVIEQTPNVFLV